MREVNGQFSKGESGNPQGRPKKAEEAFLVNLWAADGQIAFSKAVKAGRPWAIKLLVDKLYPNKKSVSAEVTTTQLPTPILSVLRSEGSA